MAMYKPGMRLSNIVSLQDNNAGNMISGLQVDLRSSSYYTGLELPTVGTKTDNWSSKLLKVSNE